LFLKHWKKQRYSSKFKERIEVLFGNSINLYTELTVHNKYEIELIGCIFADDKLYFYIFRYFISPIIYPP